MCDHKPLSDDDPYLAKAKNLSPFGWFIFGGLRIYQNTLSPVLFSIGVRCRHLPTCSNYGVQAVKLNGGWRGGWQLLARFLRCHPFGSHGFDPAPKLDQTYIFTPWRNGDWGWHEREGEEIGDNINDDLD